MGLQEAFSRVCMDNLKLVVQYLEGRGGLVSRCIVDL